MLSQGCVGSLWHGGDWHKSAARRVQGQCGSDANSRVSRNAGIYTGWWFGIIQTLVGGLEHEFYDFPYIGNNEPN